MNLGKASQGKTAKEKVVVPSEVTCTPNGDDYEVSEDTKESLCSLPTDEQLHAEACTKVAAEEKPYF